MAMSIEELKSILDKFGFDYSGLKCPHCGKVLADTATPIPTPIPTPTPNPTTKVFPHKIIFERESDEGYGNVAIILFPTLADAEITAVAVNGEVATKAHPYNGHPVFTLTKTGDKYTRPLRFTIVYGGETYTAEQSTSTTPVPTPTPAGGHNETVKPSSYGNGNRGNARFSHPGSWYGKNIEVWIDGTKVMTVEDGGKRKEGKNGLIWKPVSDSNKKLVVVGPYGLKFNSCTIKW
jgi:hypothetical protein